MCVFWKAEETEGGTKCDLYIMCVHAALRQPGTEVCGWKTSSSLCGDGTRTHTAHEREKKRKPTFSRNQIVFRLWAGGLFLLLSYFWCGERLAHCAHPHGTCGTSKGADWTRSPSCF